MEYEELLLRVFLDHGPWAVLVWLVIKILRLAGKVKPGEHSASSAPVGSVDNRTTYNININIGGKQK